MSNSLEKLAELFRENLYPPERDVFTPVRAVVPNNGMAFFLKRTLAGKDHWGIAANVECSFLQEFISGQIKKFLPEDEAKNYADSVIKWSPAVLSWRIDALFTREPEKFPWWRSYWQRKGKDDAELRHLLSCELARVLDRYQLYRREKLALWRQGGDSGSPQAELFRALWKETPDPDTFHAGFLNAPPDSGRRKLPQKIGVFGIGAMSEFHLHCLMKLSEYAEVYLFVPSPCQKYWGDVKPRREAAREAVTLEDLEAIAHNNIVLSDLGSAGRKFLERLLENGCFSDDPGVYAEPGEDTALHLFQTDILNGEARSKKVSVAAGDRSILVNNAPSARRELEALHDRLAELFLSARKEGKELRPEDVIVMFPDINKAAPLIDAVFSNGPFKESFAICDRTTAGQSSLIECFEKLLALPRKKCTSLEILDLLDFPCIHRKLGLDSETLPALSRLTARARIRWGLTGAERETFREVKYEEFSWQDGIDRLLTEFARGTIADELFPGNGTEGVDNEGAENFGKLAEFVQHLREWKQDLLKKQSAADWKETFCRWADEFFDTTDQELRKEFLELRRAITAAADSAGKAGYEEKIPLEVFSGRFETEAGAIGGRQEFLRDKITFCSLVPLRAIPAKIIAVLSLNDGDFPDSDRRQDFDLLSEALKGDPSRVDDSKYLLLEALMAAKEHLILSYVGRDNGKDTRPAVPLAVCLEAWREGFGIEPEKIPLPPVESFVPQEPDGDPQVPVSEPPPPRETPSVTEGLLVSPVPPLAPPKTMELADFCTHLTDSCGAFFSLHRGFPFNPRQEKLPEVDDPLDIDDEAIGEALWKMRLGDVPEKERYEKFAGTRLLPVGSSRDDLVEMNGKIDGISAEEVLCARQSSLQDFTLSPTAGFELHARLPVLENEKEIRRWIRRFSDTSLSQRACFYVELLFLSVCTGKAVSGRLYSSIGGKPLCPVVPEDAEKQLAELGQIVLDNCTGTAPLPLFFNASGAFARQKSTREVREQFKNDCCLFNGRPAAAGYFYDDRVLESERFGKLAVRVFRDLIPLEKLSLRKEPRA